MPTQGVTRFAKMMFVALLLFGISPVAYAQDGLADPTSAQPAQSEGLQEGNTASAAARELLVYELNRPITQKDRGFPKDMPPRAAANGDWTKPVNFAEGTLHFRVHIRKQPVPQNMKLQFCAWQYSYTLETCSKPQPVRGTSGTVVTWSQSIPSMWKLNGRPLDWKNPRQRYGMVVKNSRGKPVSSVKGWNWNGENPNHWYPLDLHFTVVVVAKGATFGGWGRYVGANAADAVEIPLDQTPAGADEGSGLEPSDLIYQEREWLYLPMITSR
jgi:hypothetical protein